jgi:myo-inositol-1(or 4)-monophosphatase
MPSFSPPVLAALRAAASAAAIQRGLFGRLRRIEYKGPQDPVTEADRASEEAIVGALRETFPDHAFVGEEGGRRGVSEHTWLIDPLDGTHNYAHGIPWFAVSIALQHRGDTVAAVVLNTMLGEVYAAERGAGAYLAYAAPGQTEWTGREEWRRIRVSPIDRLEDATLTSGFRHPLGETRPNLDHFTNILMRAGRIREWGAAALCLAAVAAGRIEGYWEIGPREWDLAAGVLLVEEAGGRASDLRGRPVALDGLQILATNGAIHDQVTAVLALGRSGLD